MDGRLNLKTQRHQMSLKENKVTVALSCILGTSGSSMHLNVRSTAMCRRQKQAVMEGGNCFLRQFRAS